MRPAKPPSERRTIKRRVGFSPDEWALLQTRAKECGRPTARYIRETALGAVIRARPDTATTALIHEVTRIGNNLNQLTRVANERGEVLTAATFGQWCDELMQLLRMGLGLDTRDRSNRQTGRSRAAAV